MADQPDSPEGLFDTPPSSAGSPPQEPPAGSSEEFARLLEQQAPAPAQQVKVGDKISGVLVRVGTENSFVDFGGRGEGVIKTGELRDEENAMQFQEGDPLEAYVLADQDEVVLTRFLHQEDREANALYRAFKVGMPVEGKVTAVNRWGLGVEVQGVKAFCPISQIDVKFVDNPEEYRDQTLHFRILRFRDQGRTIVLSRRALLEEDQKKTGDETRTRLKPGVQLEGRVTRLESFGAFVDVGGGVEGLIHVSELSHDRVEHPESVLKQGQEVKVTVLRVKDLGDRHKERISLSLKASEKTPWDEVGGQLKPGMVLQGKVEALESYGAFVEVAPNLRGLVHVSEMADRRVGHPREVVAVGAEVKVVVLEVDDRRRRLRLSMKQVEATEDTANVQEFQERQKKDPAGAEGGTALSEALKRARLIS